MEITAHTDLDDFVLWLCAMLQTHGPCRLEKHGSQLEFKFDDGVAHTVFIAKASLRYKVNALQQIGGLENG